jgi:hypothetical protein
MNTKVLMTASAALMAVAGLAFTFLPLESLNFIIPGDFSQLLIVVQVLGALYFAFAMLNWMARGNLIGGIYSRPIAIANATHFFIGGMALFKSADQYDASLIWVAAVIYLALAILFGVVLFTHPVKENSM